MNEIETARLILRRFTLDDAVFFRELLNDADWIRFIGDRNIHSDEEARAYLAKSYLSQYEKNGFGLNLAALKNGMPIGMCGLIKRDGLDDVDIGFAFFCRHIEARVMRLRRREPCLMMGAMYCIKNG